MSRENKETLRDKVAIYRARHKQRAGTRRLRDNEKALIEIIQGLDNDYEGLLVVVEGKRDESVLRSLGLRAPIVKTQSGVPRPRFIDKLASQAGKKGQVLILTDFDQKGNEISSHIGRELDIRGVKVLRRIRREIRKGMGNWRCIEELTALFKRKDSPEPAA
ncbi:MAG: toprim domain-containing protein [Candidatus Thorarchaeota archaeon]